MVVMIPSISFEGLGSKQNIAQLILVGQPTGTNTVYVDNVYFSKTPTSIGTLVSAQNSVTVYPNPVRAGGQVMIDAEIQKLEVFDITGKLLFSSRNNVLSTAGFAKGIYLMKIQNTEGGEHIQKLVVNE